jgi:tetratricopeptide (TPR) repeat protein
MLAAACKPSAEKLNQDGNDHFTEEAYLEALAAYQQALFENPELAEPYYNAANSLYREGAFPEALTLMQEALKFADEDSLTESGFYNMGNSSFNTEDWGSAVEAYKQALLVTPEDQDAKYNLELALQKQEEEQEEEEQEEESESDQNEEEQEQQEDQSESDQEQQEDESQDGEEQEGEDDPQDGEEEQEDEQEGQGQPQDGENQDQEQPSQVPPPGQRMTEEQARQLLAAIAEESETLQEHLGQIFVAPPIPPVQDW